MGYLIGYLVVGLICGAITKAITSTEVWKAAFGGAFSWASSASSSSPFVRRIEKGMLSAALRGRFFVLCVAEGYDRATGRAQTSLLFLCSPIFHSCFSFWATFAFHRKEKVARKKG